MTLRPMAIGAVLQRYQLRRRAAALALALSLRRPHEVARLEAVGVRGLGQRA